MSNNTTSASGKKGSWGRKKKSRPTPPIDPFRLYSSVDDPYFLPSMSYIQQQASARRVAQEHTQDHEFDLHSYATGIRNTNQIFHSYLSNPPAPCPEPVNPFPMSRPNPSVNENAPTQDARRISNPNPATTLPQTTTTTTKYLIKPPRLVPFHIHKAPYSAIRDAVFAKMVMGLPDEWVVRLVRFRNPRSLSMQSMQTRHVDQMLGFWEENEHVAVAAPFPGNAVEVEDVRGRMERDVRRYWECVRFEWVDVCR